MEVPGLLNFGASFLNHFLPYRGAPASYGPWLDRTGTLGFLVGVPIPDVSRTMKLPIGNAMFLMAKLLTPAEYEFIATYGLAAAESVIERFGKDQTYHLSSLHRKSVV